MALCANLYYSCVFFKKIGWNNYNQSRKMSGNLTGENSKFISLFLSFHIYFNF